MSNRFEEDLCISRLLIYDFGKEWQFVESYLLFVEKIYATSDLKLVLETIES